MWKKCVCVCKSDSVCWLSVNITHRRACSSKASEPCCVYVCGVCYMGICVCSQSLDITRRFLKLWGLNYAVCLCVCVFGGVWVLLIDILKALWSEHHVVCVSVYVCMYLFCCVCLRVYVCIYLFCCVCILWCVCLCVCYCVCVLLCVYFVVCVFVCVILCVCFAVCVFCRVCVCMCVTVCECYS